MSSLVQSRIGAARVAAPSSPQCSADIASGGRSLPSAARDFDFLFGRWQVRNRKLRERLTGCEDWDEFDARTECRPLLGGVGNLEQFDSEWQGGVHGIALRLYDLGSARWNIFWADDRAGVLEPPVIGGFEGEVGHFIGADQHRGQPVLVRFRWTRIDRDHARWEQAFSPDRGQRWETNWTMQFSRCGD